MITKPTKYTPEFVKSELKAMLQEAIEERFVVIGQLFETRDYSLQRFSEWEHDFPEHPEISESIKKIKQIFENTINAGALTGKLNPTMTIFNLKNNYGWKDQTQTDLTTKGESLKTALVHFIDAKPDNNQHPE